MCCQVDHQPLTPVRGPVTEDQLFSQKPGFWPRYSLRETLAADGAQRTALQDDVKAPARAMGRHGCEGANPIQLWGSHQGK